MIFTKLPRCVAHTKKHQWLSAYMLPMNILAVQFLEIELGRLSNAI